ncbi:hypothetical protein FOMPIDRAFT_94391 [Fomitopsis schrenkii]|uniref:Uncharacterized protein n=1 Tax=Fomitopsis schrenkii TaxID=2126942 RepID=S8DMU6_FOMSC|nr:hypothetical protein FOMPIDRAFT_94391 [Fomitopsis schrenkii]
MSRTSTNRNQWENPTDNSLNLHNILTQFPLLSLNIPVLDMRMLEGIRTGIRTMFMCAKVFMILQALKEAKPLGIGPYLAFRRKEIP